MPTHRTQMKIVGEILGRTIDTDSQEGTANTHLIRVANISQGRISTILSNLVSQGLLEKVDSKRACKYKISSSGKEFFLAYKTFREFSEDFGLTI